jgi:hypothetical protein
MTRRGGLAGRDPHDHPGQQPKRVETTLAKGAFSAITAAIGAKNGSWWSMT